MNVEQQALNVFAKAEGFADFIRCMERVIQRVHEEPRHQVRHRQFFAAGRFDDIDALAGRAFGIVRGTQ